MTEISFTFDSASSLVRMLSSNRAQLNKLGHEASQMPIEAQDLLARMYRYAGLPDDEAAAIAAKVRGPGARIADHIEAIRGDLAEVRTQVAKASQVIDEHEAHMKKQRSRLKV